MPGRGAALRRASSSLEKNPPNRLPLVAIPYHQTSLKGNIIIIYPGPGDFRSGYRERLAMIASPIVAVEEDLDDR